MLETCCRCFITCRWVQIGDPKHKLSYIIVYPKILKIRYLIGETVLIMIVVDSHIYEEASLVGMS